MTTSLLVLEERGALEAAAEWAAGGFVRYLEMEWTWHGVTRR